MADVRLALQEDLLALTALTDLVGNRVTALMRPQKTDLPCVVFRLVKFIRGNTLRGDSGEREATFELVAWAESLEDCIAVIEVLNDRYHGKGPYDFGDLLIESSEQMNEYDGDRVSDQFTDDGACAITGVYEFTYDE